MPFDRKDISDICDICKGKSENQSKFVVKEVLEREFQKPKTAIQKKDEEMGLKEAEIRSLSLEIKKFENNKKTAASELTTLKSKIREVTLQKETLEEVNKHLELEAMAKDQELTKKADKGATTIVEEKARSTSSRDNIPNSLTIGKYGEDKGAALLKLEEKAGSPSIMDNISNAPGERKEDGKVKNRVNLPQGEEELIPEILEKSSSTPTKGRSGVIDVAKEEEKTDTKGNSSMVGWKVVDEISSEEEMDREPTPKKKCYSCGCEDHVIKDCTKGNNLLVTFYYEEDANRHRVFTEFGRFGHILSVRIINRQGEPAAYICFQSERSAKDALEEIHTTPKHQRYWEAELAFNKGKECHYCHEIGHTKFQCPKLRNPRYNTDQDQNRSRKKEVPQKTAWHTSEKRKKIQVNREVEKQEAKERDNDTGKNERKGKQESITNKDSTDSVVTQGEIQQIKLNQVATDGEIKEIKEMLQKLLSRQQDL